MHLKKLAGKFPNDDRLITSMAITMAVRKLAMVYPQELAPNIHQCWGTAGTRGLRTHTMFGSKMYKLRNPHTLRWPDTVVTDGLCYSVDDPLSL